MVQLTHLQRNNRFINPTHLYIPSVKSRALHLADSGLMAGWLAGR